MQSLLKHYWRQASRDLLFEIRKIRRNHVDQTRAKPTLLELCSLGGKKKKNYRYVSSLRKTARSIVYDCVIKNFAGTVEASVFRDGSC